MVWLTFERYSDPGNYNSAISGGALFSYSLLCTILVAQILAIVLQSLSAKLAVVTSQSLPAIIKHRQSTMVSAAFWGICELSLLAADIPQIVGIAMSLNTLFGIPMKYAISCTLLDIGVVFLLYKQDGTIRSVLWLETVVAGVVSVVIVALGVILAKIPSIGFMEVLRGFLPSSRLFDKDELIASISTLSSNAAMPHALILGSCVRQTFEAATCRNCPKARAKAVEKINAGLPTESVLRSSIRFNVCEIALSLITIPMFINTAILIIAGKTMYNKQASKNIDEDLFAIHHFFLQVASPAIANIFAVSMLLSGISAGVVICLTGQALAPVYPFKREIAPWQRRLITRGILVLGLVLLTVLTGVEGLVTTMDSSQTVLTMLLPLVAGPLIYYTGSSRVMTARVSDASTNEEGVANMRNHIITQVVAWAFWLGIVAMDCHLIVTSIIFWTRRVSSA